VGEGRSHTCFAPIKGIAHIANIMRKRVDADQIGNYAKGRRAKKENVLAHDRAAHQRRQVWGIKKLVPKGGERKKREATNSALNSSSAVEARTRHGTSPSS